MVLISFCFQPNPPVMYCVYVECMLVIKSIYFQVTASDSGNTVFCFWLIEYMKSGEMVGTMRMQHTLEP